jgi:NhaP-type Na+/H+ or K+/H+ antiporter
VTTTQLIALTVGASGLVPTLAAHLRIPAPAALLFCGIGLALLPGVPELELDPFVVIFLLLPPIVYAATLRSSPRRLLRIAGWAVLPGVLLILAPMVVVALAAHAVIDGLAWSAAFILGGIATATGAELLVAADASLRLPRRLVTRLRAETTVLPALVFAAAVVIASEALQGTTLAALARRLRLDGDDGVRREEEKARERLAAAAREQSLTAAPTQRKAGRVFGAERAALVKITTPMRSGRRRCCSFAARSTSRRKRRPEGH